MTSRNLEIAARVEFRWRQHEEQFAERLAESAREAGRSPSDHARELMKTALTSAETLQHNLQNLEQELAQLHNQLRELVEIKEGLGNIHQNIYQFRDDLATCVTMLLTHAGQLDADEAKQWVEDSLDTE
jgi:phage shock protein A